MMVDLSKYQHSFQSFTSKMKINKMGNLRNTDCSFDSTGYSKQIAEFLEMKQESNTVVRDITVLEHFLAFLLKAQVCFFIVLASLFRRFRRKIVPCVQCFNDSNSLSVE
jgi:hypothetical protein